MHTLLDHFFCFQQIQLIVHLLPNIFHLLTDATVTRQATILTSNDIHNVVADMCIYVSTCHAYTFLNKAMFLQAT